eukprot:g6394.t1
MGCGSSKVGTGYVLGIEEPEASPDSSSPAPLPRSIPAGGGGGGGGAADGGGGGGGGGGGAGGGGKKRQRSSPSDKRRSLEWVAKLEHLDEAEQSQRRRDFHRLASADFEFCQVLGVGHTGKVRLARLKSTGKYYALKCIPNVDIVKKKLAAQIQVEIEVLKGLSDSPFLVGYFGAFQSQRSGGSCYLGLEYCAGGELYHRLTTNHRLPLEEAKFYTAEISVALDHVHSHGYCYRDLKPDNLLLDAAGHIKLVDFGFARPVDDNNMCSAGPCGTAQYMAPELAAAMQGSSKPVVKRAATSRNLEAELGGGSGSFHSGSFNNSRGGG